VRQLRVSSGAVTRLAWIAFLAGIVALLLGACGSGDPGPGPMRFGDGWLSGCAPARMYDHMVFQQFLSVPGHQAEITSVDTIGAVGLDVRRYVLLVDPPPGKTTIGFDGYPPTSPAWKDVIPAEGAKLPADADVFLIADAKTKSAAGGHMAGSRIHYSVGDDDYVATTHNSLEIGKCND
jgi:hypothetical protein